MCNTLYVNCKTDNKTDLLKQTNNNSTLGTPQNHVGSFVKIRVSILRGSGSVSLGWGRSIHIFQSLGDKSFWHKIFENHYKQEAAEIFLINLIQRLMTFMWNKQLYISGVQPLDVQCQYLSSGFPVSSLFTYRHPIPYCIKEWPANPKLLIFIIGASQWLDLGLASE